MNHNGFMNASIASLCRWMSRGVPSSRKHHCLSEGNRTHTHPQYAVALFVIVTECPLGFFPRPGEYFNISCVFFSSTALAVSSATLRLSLFHPLQNTTTGAARQADFKESFERSRPSYCQKRVFHSNPRRRYYNSFDPRKKSVCVRSWFYISLVYFCPFRPMAG